MTDIQEQVLRRVDDLLREHFEAAVVMVQTFSGENDTDEENLGQFHGGVATVLGLLEIARMRQLKYVDEGRVE